MDLDKSAKQQEERVLEIFRLNSYRSMHAREVHAIYILRHDYHLPAETKTPSDSIKRAITNLTRKKKLIKNPKQEQVVGPYGVMVFTWKINTKPTVQTTLL